MRDSDATVTFEDCEVLIERPFALLCVINDAEKWIPKSQVHSSSEVIGEGDKGDLVISEWYATKEGLV